MPKMPIVLKVPKVKECAFGAADSDFILVACNPGLDLALPARLVDSARAGFKSTYNFKISTPKAYHNFRHFNIL